MGILAAKKLALYGAKKLEPVIAEYSARSAIGASAGAAVVKTKTALRDTARAFLLGGSRASLKEYTDNKRPKLSMDSYKEAIEDADRLTSDAHIARVRETQQALVEAGHPELAQEWALTYGRTNAIVRAAKPKGEKFPRLGKEALEHSPSSQGMKFYRVLHTAKDPVGTLIRGVLSGDLSRTEVAAFKAAAPDVHAYFVQAVMETIVEAKTAGKNVAADSLVTLGVALNYPVDSTLQKGFIDACQKGLAANKAPPPGGQSPPPNPTDTTSFQTPLQASV
jgi:hypothetical protein